MLTDWFNTLRTFIKGNSLEAIELRILAVLLVLSLWVWLYLRLRRFLIRRLSEHDSTGETLRVFRRISWSVTVIVVLFSIFHTLGVDLSAVFTTGGLFAVAFAFAMKNLSENLVSGVIVRLERTIKPGDILETEGLMVKVLRINFRATIVRTKDERNLVIPNAQLVQSTIKNYTYRDALCRVAATVGIPYDADYQQVQSTLEDICAALDWNSSHKESKVRLSQFGESAVQFKVYVWIDNPWDLGQRQSQLTAAIWQGLRQAHIDIAFPQLDVHMDGDLTTKSGVSSRSESGSRRTS
jgi:small-conductance mechanosensitive channel